MDIAERKNFSAFINKSTLYLLDLNNDNINCNKAEEVSEESDYLKYRDHLKTLYKDIFPSPNKNEHLTFHGFSNTIDRLQRVQPKKKLFCRKECCYLVKKSFTEGVQYVKQGEIHTYKAIARPLDIYISNTSLDLKTFRGNYDFCTVPERISPGETKVIPSSLYYVVIAPCHTFFIKEIKNTLEVENSTEISFSFATEADRQVMSVTEDRNGSREQISILDRIRTFPQASGSRDNEHGNSKRCLELENGIGISPSFATKADRQVMSVTEDRNVPSEQMSILDRVSTFHQPSGSRDNEHGNSKRCLELENRFVSGKPEMVNDSASPSIRRFFTENDRQSKRAKSSTPDPRESSSRIEAVLVPPSPNSLRREMELMSNNGTSNYDHGRAVFAIRKDSNIESYALRSDSTFCILQDNIMTGWFAIENEDMDPYVIEYHGDVQFIREVAKFKNGSSFETTLTVQKDLLNELRDSTRKKEKVVVNYFFEFAFKSIEAAYKKFSEMRHTKMIGSCVPAIVPLGDARFFGAVSDAYEAKP